MLLINCFPTGKVSSMEKTDYQFKLGNPADNEILFSTLEKYVTDNPIDRIRFFVLLKKRSDVIATCRTFEMY